METIQSLETLTKSNDKNADHSFDQYISFLKKQGLQYNQSLYPAFFQLKNGLKYAGMKTSTKINKNQTIIKVPIQMLLTTYKALQEQQLSQIFKDKFFYQIYNMKYAEGRILVVYLLYLLKYKPDSLWAIMAKYLPKNIDILSFWQNTQILKFKDPTIKIAVQLQLNNFQNQYSMFQSLRQKYQILQDQNIFNFQNYKWIYIHTVSRCFGSFMDCKYFVPFCQLLNHHCVDVSYKCIEKRQDEKEIEKQQDILILNQKKQQNIGINQKMKNKSKRQFKNQIDQDCDSSSSSSANSQQYIQQNDFDYLSISTYQIKWCSKESFDLKPKQTKKIQQQIKKINKYINQILEWKRGSTVVYICQAIQKLKIIQSQYTAGRKKFQFAINQLENLYSHILNFYKESNNYFRRNHQSYQRKPPVRNRAETQKQVEQTSNTTNIVDNYQKNFLKSPNKTYKQFVMQTLDNTYYNQGNEVYFSYGRHSNRTLLIRYGFCLQQNKYQHVWIKVSLSEYLSAYPDTTQKIQQKGLPIIYKMKMKYSKICTQLILWYKSLKWRFTHDTHQDMFYITNIQKQIQVLFKCKQICLKNLQIYGQKNQILQDMSIGYHQYFIRVYHNQKRKIILQQISLFEQCLIFLKNISLRIQSGQKISQIKDKIDFKLINKKIRGYLKGIKGLLG